MTPTRTVAAVVLAGALAAAGGCGGSTGDQAQDGAPTVAATSPTPSATPTPMTTPVTTPAATRTPKPSPTPGSDGGDGDADEQAAPSTAGGGVCSHLGAEQVGAILGSVVRGAAVPGERGCTFEQAGKRGTRVTVLDRSAAQAGGMAGAKDEATSAVEGEPEDVAGIGTAAFVVTGSMFGGPDVQGAGAVRTGTRIISVFLEQHTGVDAARVKAIETDLLRLVAGAAG